MRVEVIDRIEDFAALADDWNRVYGADARARYFLSHPFLSGWLATIRGAWLVLAARDKGGGPCRAFFPLRVSAVRQRDGTYVNIVYMAGNYGADYTGMICEPAVERDAVTAFAARLKQMHWQSVVLDYVPADDPRYQHLAAHFPRATFAVGREQRVNLRDNVDNLVCPWVRLPESFEDYLATLSANMRQKLRRLLRALEADPELTVGLSTPGTFEEDLAALGRLWADKWVERKGAARIDSLLNASRSLVRQVWGAGDLFMPVLRRNGQVVAVLATFLDRQKKAAHFYMTGRDESFEGPAPGLLLHAWSIRQLIGEGCIAYDFMRGNEPYKWLFGSEPLNLQCLRVTTRSGRNLGGCLDRRSLPLVIEGATQMHRKGRFAEAEAAYIQVLELEPDNLHAIYRYAQLLETRGDYGKAGRLYRRLLAVNPRSTKVWERMAECLDQLGYADEARAAVRRAAFNMTIN
ncbi:GNAT family N-acetyltransferase [Devosia geojensis]|uniref:GNAT family N-acetyltransferase n=1 Tax=Devosia geojensis TaxID=443610 RepID=UPI0006965832|nr:GNAT family N-acetyltransferase [Devosia geojensis]